MSRKKGQGIKGRELRRDDMIACAHTALKPLLVASLPSGGVRVVQAECLNCHAQLRDVSA